jgi:hypothetical protein
MWKSPCRLSLVADDSSLVRPKRGGNLPRRLAAMILSTMAVCFATAGRANRPRRAPASLADTETAAADRIEEGGR